MKSKEIKCRAGCVAFSGMEIKHHPDCVHYPESMSKIYDQLKEKTTSQQQTIERLREENRTLKSLIKSLYLYEHATTYNFELEYKDHHYDADTSFLESQKELIESEQLLNTTEPIDQ